MTTDSQTERLASLDQFRGYTVVAMLFVNFAGSYPATPTTFRHHHTYCSFADTIMPQFLFAVGFAMRLTFLKRLVVDGAKAAYRKAIVRSLALFLLACVIYHLTGEFKTSKSIQEADWSKFFEQLFKRGPFETLAHIAVTSLFVLPVIAKGPSVRLAYLVLAGIIHLVISYFWYYQWNMTNPVGIDGGPFGFISWSIPLLFGSLAYDWVTDRKEVRVLLAGAVAMLLACGLLLVNRFTEPNVITHDDSWARIYEGFPFTGPGSPYGLNIWTMSQRAGSVSYTLFGTGFALTIFSIFRRVCDSEKVTIPLYGLFGRHALATYIIHDMVASAVHPFVPKDAPFWFVLCGFLVYFFVTWLFVRYLDRNNLHLRL